MPFTHGTAVTKFSVDRDVVDGIAAHNFARSDQCQGLLFHPSALSVLICGVVDRSIRHPNTQVIHKSQLRRA